VSIGARPLECQFRAPSGFRSSAVSSRHSPRRQNRSIAGRPGSPASKPADHGEPGRGNHCSVHPVFEKMPHRVIGTHSASVSSIALAIGADLVLRVGIGAQRQKMQQVVQVDLPVPLRIEIQRQVHGVRVSSRARTRPPPGRSASPRHLHSAIRRSRDRPRSASSTQQIEGPAAPPAGSSASPRPCRFVCRLRPRDAQAPAR